MYTIQLQLHFIERFNIQNATTITIHEKPLIYTIQLQLHFMERFNIHNATTITIHGKHLIYTMELQLQFTNNMYYTQYNCNYNS